MEGDEQRRSQKKADFRDGHVLETRLLEEEAIRYNSILKAMGSYYRAEKFCPQNLSSPT